MLFREIIAAYSANNTKYINKFCVKNTEYREWWNERGKLHKMVCSLLHPKSPVHTKLYDYPLLLQSQQDSKRNVT